MSETPQQRFAALEIEQDSILARLDELDLKIQQSLIRWRQDFVLLNLPAREGDTAPVPFKEAA